MASKAFRVRAELKPRSSTQPGSSSPLDLEAPLRVSSTAYNNRENFQCSSFICQTGSDLSPVC